MVTRHMVAELAFQVFNQGGYAGGCLAAIEGDATTACVLVRTVFPGHDGVPGELAPPVGRVRPKPRQEQGLGVGAKNLLASAVGGAPVRRLSRRGPRHAHRETDEVHANRRSHLNLRFERAGRTAQVSEWITRPIESHRQVPRGFRARPERNAITVAAHDGQVRQVVNVPVGPFAAGWPTEVNVKPTGPVFACGCLYGDGPTVLAALGGQVVHARVKASGPFSKSETGVTSLPEVTSSCDIVEEHVTGRLAEAEVYRPCMLRVRFSRELELDATAGGST